MNIFEKAPNKWIIIAILLVVSVVPFSNIFNNVFALDDFDFFIYWEGIKHLNISSFFAGDLPLSHIHVYRPIRSVVQAVFYYFAQTNLWPYHILSIVVHFVNTVLIYLITKKLSKQAIALMTAIFFAVLPVHVVAITFITAVFDTMGITFLLGSFLLFITFKEGHKKKYLYSSLGLALLAYFTNEITLTLPLLIILYYFCFREVNKKILWRNVKYYWWYFLGAIAVFTIRYFILKDIYKGSLITKIDLIPRLLTASKAFIKYIYLMVINTPLSVHHPVEIVYTVDTKVFGSIVLIIALIVLAIYLYKKGQKIYTFIITWFFISMLPVANIIQIANFIDERYLYLASYAWSLLLAIIVYLIYFYFKDKKGALIAMLLVLILSFTYGYMTWQRNKVWQTEETLWRDVITKYPNNIKAYNNLGFYYSENGDNEKAEEYYRKAIGMNENYSIAYTGLAETAIVNDDYIKAAEYLEQAIELNPNKPGYFNQLGMIYSNLEQWDKAKKNYQKALDIYPDFFESSFNLAVIYVQEQNFTESLKYFQKSAELRPDDVETVFGVGMSYLGLGKEIEGKQYLRKALLLDPKFPPALEVLEGLE
ncbi:tetratricopeptide repeat protein [bacterium]|nr:tetratricopeptide repeat protein [bacterium]